MFPMISIAYTEITMKTIHKHDLGWIRKIVKKDESTKSNSEAILVYTKGRIFRRAFFRLLLLFPLFAWASLSPEFLVRVGLYSIITVYLVIIVWQDKIPKI